MPTAMAAAPLAPRRPALLRPLLVLLAAGRARGFGNGRLIIDTDMSTDCDDVGALCMAHAMQDVGMAEILAVVHNTGLPEGVGAISSINNYYGRNDIPIGAFKGEFGLKLPGAYVSDLVSRFPGPIRNYTQVPDALEVYRKVLAAQPERSVTIASIGFMTNLAALLQSPPDSYSPLNGTELVASRVIAVSWMGGYFPTSGIKHEWNFGGGAASGSPLPSPVSCAATSYAVKAMPPSVEVVFSGYEVGANIFTGAVLTKCADDKSPCRQAYIDRQGLNTSRESWDPATTLMAVIGIPDEDYERVGRGGQCVVNSITGCDSWVAQSPTKVDQSYLVLRQGRNVSIAKMVDQFLCQPPAARRAPAHAEVVV